MLARYMPWPCVRVCLSRVGVLLKRLNIESRKQNNAIHRVTSIHWVKRRHIIYGHDTIAILWVQLGMMCGVKGKRFNVLFK